MKGITFRIVGATAMILAGLATMAPLQAADNAAKIIKERQALMKEQGRQMKAINTILENGGGDISEIAAHAKALAASAQKIPMLFPEGTGMDDDIGRTGAKAAIWEDWAKFEAAAHELQQESTKLIDVAATGDKAAAAAQFAALGKQGCGGCHTPFRQKLD